MIHVALVSDMAWLWWLGAQRLAGKELIFNDDTFWHEWISAMEITS